MNEELFANVTVNEYYPLYPGVNTTSAGFILGDNTEHHGPCVNFNKTPPMFLYVNRSQMLYPGTWRRMNYEHAIKVCAVLIIIIAGLIGNISVILTIAYNKSMRTTVNFYIANLAIADFMTCVFAMPAFYRVLPLHYGLGHFVCKVGNFALCTCLVCSVLTLSAISCDRFVTVFFPLHGRVTKKRKSLVMFFIWILSILASIPYSLVNQIQVTEWKDFQEKRCASDWSNERYYHKSLGSCVVWGPLFISQTLLMAVFLFLLPILIMITAYSFILWKLSRKKIPEEQQSANDLNESCERKRVHKMIFIVLLAFVVSWMPYQIGILYDITHPKRNEIPKWWGKFAWAAWCIELCNSFMNPIIYAGMTKEFRQGMYAVLRCRKPVIRSKPHPRMRHTLDGAKEQETVDLDIDIKDTLNCRH